MLFRHYGADSVRVARARLVATGGQEYPELPGAGEGGRAVAGQAEGRNPAEGHGRPEGR